LKPKLARILGVAFAALAFAANVAALPAFADDRQPPELTATGEGIVMATPDMASVTLGVISEGKTAAEAMAKNSGDMAAAIDAVKAAGVAEKDIATTGFNIGPVYSNPRPRDDGSSEAPRITGYQVSNDVRVVIRDLAKAGDILDKVVAAGANRATSIDFDLADRKSAVDSAIKIAIADARARAELMAEASGVKLGRLVSVQAGEGGGPMPRFDAAPMAMKAAPVMAGERQITANATLVYEIEGK
jgi:uncharacterized protein YggE